MIIDKEEKSDIIPNVWENIRIIAQRNEISLVSKELKEIEDKLRIAKPHIVVIGLFKRGKSSLINALLDHKIAPVAVTPVTSVITFFEYGEDFKAEIVFENDAKEWIKIDQIEEFVSEELNPANVKKVKYVKVYLPDKLLESIVLVDTPGLGSLYEHNSEVSTSFIPKIDAAVFVLSADLPISKADGEFLKTVSSRIPEIIFVINKSDLLDKDEMAKICNYNLSEITKITGRSKENLTVHTTSGKKYFQEKEKKGKDDSGVVKLRQALMGMALANGETMVKHSVKERLKDLVEYSEGLLSLQLTTLKMPVEDLKAEQRMLNSSLEVLRNKKDDFLSVLKGQLTKLKEEAKVKIEEEDKIIQIEIEHSLAKLNENTANKIDENYFDDFQARELKRINSKFHELHESLLEHLKGKFQNLMIQYQKHLQDFLNELSTQVEKRMGVKSKLMLQTFNLSAYTSFYLKSTPELHIPRIAKGSFFRLFPGIFVKKYILNRLRKNFEEILLTNSAGMIYDLNYKINESFRKFSSEIEDHTTQVVESLLNVLDNRLSMKDSIENQMKDKISVVEGGLNELLKIKGILEKDGLNSGDYK